MRLNYKRLGEYIQVVNIRNTDLKGEILLGVSIKKILMPSIANTIGTNMATYKLIKRNQFAYGPVTSRNGDKISVAQLVEYDNAIVSQAYVVFEVIDTDELDPEYLMMWFRRPEFDRYARFKSHGSARETFDWDEMCETELPVPSIEKQREIVKEYNTIVNRITLNETLNQKLEETAQSLYKHWFVDFEFPNAEGKPYKSSGGKMEFNEELDMEIPEGWGSENLGEVSNIMAGGDKPRVFSDYENNRCKVPIYSNSMINDGLFGYTNEAKITEKSITISARGGIGFTVLRTKPFLPIVRLIVVTPKFEYLLNYIFHCALSFEYNDVGSAQKQLTIPDISEYKIVQPNSEILKQFQGISKDLFHYKTINNKEIKKLKKLIDLILSKMSKVETNKVLI